MTTSLTDFFSENPKWSRPESFIKESRPILQVKNSSSKAQLMSCSFEIKPRAW